MSAMNKYLAGVLTVIAVGVMAIAYSLAFPSTPSTQTQGVTPMTVSGMDGWGCLLPVNAQMPGGTYVLTVAPASVATVPARESWAATAPLGREPRYDVSHDTSVVAPTRTIRTVEIDEPVRAPRRVTRVVERPRRDWKRTAMVIGGTTAASAGIGGIVGGKKGALIGAAIGGGASTIYETTKGR